ncbi:MAG TPA: endonuclease/exonuclease/phosphatase family protein [Anaerolineales bacterium]|nr:endonuclease/exonuclease/phosphatase family protein [Anaerolineales bacterium]
MPIFPKPKFEFEYDVEAERARLRAHRKKRGIPRRTKDRLLVATWNIANLGAQQRRSQDRALLAEVIAWFDLVAVQEVRENFGELFDIHQMLPKTYRVLMSDAAGNNERMAFLFDGRKMDPLEEIGEIALPPSEYDSIRLKDNPLHFDGFDRTPYLAAFSFGETSFVFVNVHLFYGTAKKASVNRRQLETYAVAKWSARRQKSPFSFTRELVTLGDFNMPKSEPGDAIFDALTRLGLEVPLHSTQIASSIASDANYDQVAFLPGTTKRTFTGSKGVFDFDTVVFPELWQGGANRKNFLAYLRYYLSDHRPMWVQLQA